MSFSTKLKELRLQNNLTQENLARKLDILRNSYIYYETGKKYPPVEVLIRMAKFFNVSISFLLDEQSENNNDLYMSFHEQLKELRLQNDLSQEKMSRKLGMVTRTYIFYETGQKFPSVDMLIRIAKVFKVNISFVINEQGEYTVEIQRDRTSEKKNE